MSSPERLLGAATCPKGLKTCDACDDAYCHLHPSARPFAPLPVARGAYAVYSPDGRLLGVVHRVQRSRSRHAWMLDGGSERLYPSCEAAAWALCDELAEAVAAPAQGVAVGGWR